MLDSASVGLYLREHIKKGVFVVGAVEQVVTSAAEAYQVPCHEDVLMFRQQAFHERALVSKNQD